MWLHFGICCAMITWKGTRKMKRNDWILIGIVIGIALLFGGMQFFKSADSDGIVQVTVDGELYGEYSLEKNTNVQIGNTNYLTIKNGKATMIEASCPDQLCVQQKSISKDGESIICLPNKVIATVIGGEESEIDTIAN